MTTNAYAAFQTNKGLEETGVWLDYGPFRVLTARAGGANKRFARTLEAKTRPYQRAIKTETMDNAIAERIMREVFATVVVLDWETKVPSEEDPKLLVWKKTIQMPDGSLAPVSPENISAVLEAVPDLFQDIQESAQRAANFRDAVREANAGN